MNITHIIDKKWKRGVVKTPDVVTTCMKKAAHHACRLLAKGKPFSLCLEEANDEDTERHVISRVLQKLMDSKPTLSVLQHGRQVLLHFRGRKDSKGGGNVKYGMRQFVNRNGQSIEIGSNVKQQGTWRPRMEMQCSVI